MDKLLKLSLILLLFLDVGCGGVWCLCLFGYIVVGGVIIINHPSIGLHQSISTLLQAFSIIEIILLTTSLFLFRYIVNNLKEI